MAGILGLRLFLVSLAVLFGSGLTAFVFMRLHLQEQNVWPTDLPPLPKVLWASTAVLALSSATLQWALSGIRRGDVGRLQGGLIVTLLLGLMFLLLQARCWLVWLAEISQRWHESDEFRFALTSFYVLTGLHALHVIGGLVSLTIVARQAVDRAYSRDFHPGVQYATTYWHFLGAMWLILYASLLLGL